MTVLLFSDTSMERRALGSRCGPSPPVPATKTCTVAVVMEMPSVTENVMESSSIVSPLCSYCRIFRVMSLKEKVSPADQN